MAGLARILFSLLALASALILPPSTLGLSVLGEAHAANPMVELVSGGDVIGDVSGRYGDVGGDDGGDDGCGGKDREQSSQSVPAEQLANSAPGPPSSH